MYGHHLCRDESANQSINQSNINMSLLLCMVSHRARKSSRINRVRLPILLVVSWTGKMNISLSAFAPENSAFYVSVCVCVLSSHLFWTPDLWTHQPGSHRRKVTQNLSTFLQRCLPKFFSREGFSCSFPSSTLKSNFVYPRVDRSPLVGDFFFSYWSGLGGDQSSMVANPSCGHLYTL